MQFTVAEIAKKLDCELVSGNSEKVISGYGSLEKATKNDLSFFQEASLQKVGKYKKLLKETKAGAVIINDKIIKMPAECSVLYNPKSSKKFTEFIELIKNFGKTEINFSVHPQAYIGKTAKLKHSEVKIGASTCIGEETSIGSGTIIGSNVNIGEKVKIGKKCRIYSNVSIYDECIIGDNVTLHSGVVIGADGFGFEQANGKNLKVPHYGNVEIGNNVEIGANSCVDRARFDTTRIGAGTIIDNLVQVGHNVEIGENCVFAAQVGIAGSVKINDNVIVAAQVGIAGHLEICSGVILMGRTGVTSSISKPGIYWGLPAKTATLEKKILIAQKKLPELIKKLRA